MDQYWDSFREATSSMVSDALDELGLDGVLVGLQARHDARTTSVGRALTVSFQAKSHDESAYRFGGGVGRPLEAVLRLMEQDDFILFDLDGSDRAACWGGLASRLAKRQGVAGVAVWGGCRDLTEIRQLEFPVWSSSVCPRRSRNDFTFGSVKEPIEVAGVTVESGDIVVGDASGMVVVPYSHAASVAEVVQRIIDQESVLESQLEQGDAVNWDEI